MLTIIHTIATNIHRSGGRHLPSKYLQNSLSSMANVAVEAEPSQSTFCITILIIAVPLSMSF